MKNIIRELCSGQIRPFLCIDKEAQRFYGHGKASHSDVARIVVLHALFGRSVYVSDKYLLLQPSAQALLHEERGLLREMLRTGFAWLVTSTATQEECGALPAKWLAKNVDPNFEGVWQRIVRHAFKNNKVATWPHVRSAQGYGSSPASTATSVRFQRYPPEHFQLLAGSPLPPSPVSRTLRLAGARKALQQQFGPMGQGRFSFAPLKQPELAWCNSIVVRQDLGLDYQELLITESPEDSLGPFPVMRAPDSSVVSPLKQLVDAASEAYRIKKDYARSIANDLFDKAANLQALRAKIKKRTAAYLNALQRQAETAQERAFFAALALDSQIPPSTTAYAWREVMPAVLAWSSE